METKGGYDKMKKGYDHSMSDYSPNAGEGHMFFDSSSSRAGTTGIVDAAGVKDGLSAVDGIQVKDAEMVTVGQRPESRRESAGNGFEIGC